MTALERLSESYDRLHRFGPEYGGDEEGNHGMTNHGPMAVEVMLRRGLDIDVDRWLDRYVRRLTDAPASTTPISAEQWWLALGSAKRLPDWTDFFQAELRRRAWTEVLTEWWPRLLPGIVAGSTHGVIRVGHAVRTLRTTSAPAPEALDELAHGLAFWAARYRELGNVAPVGRMPPRSALPAVARLEDQSGFIAHRLARLERSAHWVSSLRALRPVDTPTEVPAQLEELIDIAVEMYLLLGRASPVLLVHAATAPNAVRHVLPILPADQWRGSLNAAWCAAAAVIAAYAPRGPRSRDTPRGHHPRLTPDDALQRAAVHGDEHVLKFADTAVEAYDRTGDPRCLAATIHAGLLIAPP